MAKAEAAGVYEQEVDTHGKRDGKRGRITDLPETTLEQRRVYRSKGEEARAERGNEGRGEKEAHGRKEPQAKIL